MLRKVILLACFALSMQYVRSQNNLQFNRVRTYALTVPSFFVSFDSVIVDTVPPGKVWKISAKGIHPLGTEFKVNGKKYSNYANVTIGPVGSPINYIVVDEVLWLKSGDCISLINYGQYDEDYVLSIIEYNVY
jgi:hypothetical protein